MESKGPDDTLRMCILRMFEGTFSLEAAHLSLHVILIGNNLQKNQAETRQTK